MWHPRKQFMEPNIIHLFERTAAYRLPVQSLSMSPVCTLQFVSLFQASAPLNYLLPVAELGLTDYSQLARGSSTIIMDLISIPITGLIFIEMNTFVSYI